MGIKEWWAKKQEKWAVLDDKGNIVSKSKDYNESTQQNPKQKVIINI